jgi:hypothetical protein
MQVSGAEVIPNDDGSCCIDIAGKNLLFLSCPVRLGDARTSILEQWDTHLKIYLRMGAETKELDDGEKQYLAIDTAFGTVAWPVVQVGYI